MAKQKLDPNKPINYSVRGIGGGRDYVHMLKLVEAQLGRSFGHAYDAQQGIVMFTTDIEIDTSGLSKSGLVVKVSQ